jgi:hypothetical protein
MKLVTHVIMAVSFSAITLWSQTSDTDRAAEVLPSFEDTRTPSSLADNSVPFKLNLAQSINSIFILAANSTPLPSTQMASSQTPPSRPKAVGRGSSYLLRKKIHKYASIATLPLFVSEAIVGQKLFDRAATESDSLRSTHSALAAGIGVLFGVESVTGIWNLWETRKISTGRKKRMVHGILMLAADAGFVATAALAPHREHDGTYIRDDASAHRAVAYASFGVAATGYVYMLFAR